MPEQKRSRLGRGLSSLMAKPVPVAPPPKAPAPAPEEPAAKVPDETPASAARGPAAVPGGQTDPGPFHALPIDRVHPNASQPRKRFDQAMLEGLAQSIRSEGVMQPVIVRAVGDRYEIVAGERRWRAAKLAGLETLPSLVRELDDRQVAEWSLVENLQREDLNPIERAEAFQVLANDHGMSHDEIAEHVGVNRSTVANAIRLLKLDPTVRDMVIEGLLSNGQARALVGVNDGEVQLAIAQQAVRQAWSVRQLEDELRRRSAPAKGTTSSEAPKPSVKTAHLADLERQLAEQLETKVRVKQGRKKGTGTLSIEFYSVDQFDTLLSKLGVSIED